MRISQREARRLRKRVAELEQQERARRNAWSGDWFCGVNIATVTPDPVTLSALKTARLLKHAVVCITDMSDHVRFQALPLADKVVL